MSMFRSHFSASESDDNEDDEYLLIQRNSKRPTAAACMLKVISHRCVDISEFDSGASPTGASPGIRHSSLGQDGRDQIQGRRPSLSRTQEHSEDDIFITTISTHPLHLDRACRAHPGKR